MSKMSVDDLFPIKGKRVLLRVDFNVPIKEGVIQNDYRIRSALPTIRRIIDQGGRCIVMSHMGRPTGVPMSESDSNLSQMMKTWKAEKGRGKTNFFAGLPAEEKVWILQQLGTEERQKFPVGWGSAVPDKQGSGKVAFFAGLPEETKTQLLNAWRDKNNTPETVFSTLRKYHGYSEESTLEPVAARLGELLEKKVDFARDCLNAGSQVDALGDGEVLLLENVRFYKEENSKKEEDRLRMAKVLASYGDYYVCDAFGTAHRDAATITGIPKVLGHGVAGYLMKKEIDSFAAALTNPQAPTCAIVGGSKVSDKIKVLENLVKKVNKLFIGGAMAYVFLKAQGVSVGKSFCEKGQSFTDKYGEERDSITDMAVGLLEKAKAAGVELYLPLDHVCHTEFKATDKPLVTEGAAIPDGYMALDIGPKTRELYFKEIKACNTVVWNGPMGVFEIQTFSQGTFEVARALAECQGMTIIGGGDSASAAELSGHADKITHVSTGGGASLELLEGKVLPGIAALNNAPPPQELERRLSGSFTAEASSAVALTSVLEEVRQLRKELARERSFDPMRDVPLALLNALAVGGFMWLLRGR